jgi:hypothetical protein
MSTPIGIEAALPYLSARELAELQKVLREREKRRTRVVTLRAPQKRVSLGSARRTSKRLRPAVV